MRKAASVEGQCVSRGSTGCPAPDAPALDAPLDSPATDAPATDAPATDAPAGRVSEQHQGPVLCLYQCPELLSDQLPLKCFCTKPLFSYFTVLS